MDTIPDRNCINNIPFKHFVDFVQRIGSTKKASRRLDILESWLADLRQIQQPLPPNAAKLFFRFLFPDHDLARKYNLQETGLARSIASALCLGHRNNPNARARPLFEWADLPDDRRERKTGCLGDVVRALLGDISSDPADSERITFGRVDELLHDLAKLCPYTTEDREKETRRNRDIILRELYSESTPDEARVVTQIILKDMTPILEPFDEAAFHPTTALATNRVKSSEPIFTLHQVMKEWDPIMPAAYRFNNDLLRFAEEIGAKPSADMAHEERDALCKPRVGSVIEIPKCWKGRGIKNAIELMGGAKVIWAETKYDGERMQIHINLEKDDPIVIFSKSRRDSTWDRIAIHEPVLASINHANKQIRKTAILEGEMVAYNKATQEIDEFYHIRPLVDASARGQRAKQPILGKEARLLQIEESSETHHLMVVFFDILYLDGKSLLEYPYERRRKYLEKVVKPVKHLSMLAQRHKIEMRSSNTHKLLKEIFIDHIARYQEGLVIKAEGSHYGRGRAWVKLKRDYIPGLGDTADLVIFGASWEKKRGRELQVSPNTFTTFHIGAIDRAREETPPYRPVVVYLFSCSYLDHKLVLEHLNALIHTIGLVGHEETKAGVLPYKFEFPERAKAKCSQFLKIPLAGEFYGAGFTKEARSESYQLRFPRMSKLYRHGDRDWLQTMDFQEFQQVAARSSGQDQDSKEADLDTSKIWGGHVSPNAQDKKVVDIRRRAWWETFEVYDDLRDKARVREMILGIAHGDMVLDPSSKRALRAFRPLTNVSESPSFSITAWETPSKPPKKRKDPPSPSTDSTFPSKRTRTETSTGSTPRSRDPQELFHRQLGLYKSALPEVEETDREEDGSESTTQRFYNADHNEHINTGLVQYFLNSGIWVEQKDLRLTKASRPPSAKLFPPGFRFSWVGAFLHALGWTARHVIFYEGTPKKGVILISEAEAALAVDYFKALVSQVGDANSADRRPFVLLPVEILSEPSLTWPEIEQRILWRSPL